MTMINPTPSNHTNPVEEGKLHEEIKFLKEDRVRVGALKDSYAEKFGQAQTTIRNIVKDINSDIKDLGLDKDDSFPLDNLSDIFEKYGLELDFDRLFKVEVEYTVRAYIEVEAADEDDAKAHVEANTSLYDISISDGNLLEWDVTDEDVTHVEEVKE